MSQKEHQRQLFIEKRTRALATMLLARRANLWIEEVNEDIGLAYIVRFLSEGKEGLREFGIALKGVWTVETKEQADKALRPSLRQMKQYGPFPLPVCLFFFTMENDEAWYTWVAEPIEAEDGKPLLQICKEPDCRRLDKKAMNEILERLDVWYDAFFPRLIVNVPQESKTDHKRATI